MIKVDIGIIGGSGLYDIEGINIIDETDIDTPWGKPSDTITIAEIDGVKAAFLPRHGKGHFLLPSEVNSQANIAALKMLGAKKVIAFSAVGSLKEKIVPGHFILPDQVIDRTKNRVSTYFGNGVVAHISLADPFCKAMQDVIAPEAEAMNIPLHKNETLICMEGPAFSTRAESNLYRSWNAGIINMSVLPEAKLAKEAELCYAMICMSTDYDCWKEEEEAVSVDMVIETLQKNSANAKNLIKKIIPKLGKDLDCQCSTSMKYAIMTAPERRNPETSDKLKTILPKYF